MRYLVTESNFEPQVTTLEDQMEQMKEENLKLKNCLNEANKQLNETKCIFKKTTKTFSDQLNVLILQFYTDGLNAGQIHRTLIRII